MGNKEFTISYQIFMESGQFVAFSPGVKLAFNAREKERAINTLKEASKMQIEDWQERGLIIRDELKKPIAHQETIDHFKKQTIIDTGEFTINI